MSHCYSIGVRIEGKEKEICLVVPKNKRIKEELDKDKAPKPTPQEVDNAIEYHLNLHKHELNAPRAEFEQVLDY
jgi:hypothetical protein